jgi:hypothetical protein
MVRELAEIVGYESSASEQPEGTELSEKDLALLREMASGSLSAQESTPDQVDGLLAKLRVASPAEALEYAIKAGVSWQ